jgi:hypothetical protein
VRVHAKICQKQRFEDLSKVIRNNIVFQHQMLGTTISDISEFFFKNEFLVVWNILPQTLPFCQIQRFMDSTTVARAPFECVCGFTAG